MIDMIGVIEVPGDGEDGDDESDEGDGEDDPIQIIVPRFGRCSHISPSPLIPLAALQSNPQSKPKTHLSLLRRPLPIGIPIKHQLITPRIPNFHRRVRNRSLGRPLKSITSGFEYREGLGASLITFAV